MAREHAKLFAVRTDGRRGRRRARWWRWGAALACATQAQLGEVGLGLLVGDIEAAEARVAGAVVPVRPADTVVLHEKGEDG